MGAYVAPKDPFVAMFYSRAYLNATALREGAKRMPGGSPEAIDEQYLGRQRDPNVPAWKPSFADLRGWAPVLPRMVWLMMRSGDEIAAIETQVRQLDERDRHTDLSLFTAAQLVADLRRGMDLGREVAATHIGVSGGASSTFETLGRLTKSWLGDETGSLQATLVTGLTEVESAKPSRALWDLSRLAIEAPEVSAALDSGEPAQALEELRGSNSEAARRFARDYDAFIERYGHRSVMEGELSAPLWEEDPGTVFAMLRNLREDGPEADPHAGARRQQELRARETQRALAALPAPKRLVFKRVLSMAQGYVANRERTKSLLVKGTQRARRLARELGCRLADSGAIEAPDDVFYLTVDDLARVADGQETDMRAHVARRQAEMERNRAVVLPESFVGRPRPGVAEAPVGAATLKGIPVSPGVASGVARVIMDPRVDGELHPGEILVAPVTDAGRRSFSARPRSSSTSAGLCRTARPSRASLGCPPSST
jgi:pyruvate,water dikinase